MSKRGMRAKISFMAVAAIAGLVVGYSLLSPSTSKIGHAVPQKDEITKAAPVDSGTDFNEVNLPPDIPISRAKPLHPAVASRGQPQQGPPSDEQVRTLPDRRQPDTPKQEDTEPEVSKAIPANQPKDGSNELKPVEQYEANVESDDDDDDDDDE